MQKQNNIHAGIIKENFSLDSLTQLNGKEIQTHTLIVSNVSGKPHKVVLKAVKNLKEIDDDDRLNFVPIFYNDSYGRKQKMYSMDRRSFSILAMGFTGKKALKWKHIFYDAFEKMERTLLNRQNASWQQARIEGKQSRFKLTEAIKRLVELAKANGSKNADKYYISITNMIYKQVFNLKKVPDRFRDNLNENELYQLELVEWKIAEWLNKSIDKCLDYHEPFPEIKSKLKNLVAVIGIINLNRQIEV